MFKRSMTMRTVSRESYSYLYNLFFDMEHSLHFKNKTSYLNEIIILKIEYTVIIYSI